MPNRNLILTVFFFVLINETITYRMLHSHLKKPTNVKRNADIEPDQYKSSLSILLDKFRNSMKKLNMKHKKFTTVPKNSFERYL